MDIFKYKRNYYGFIHKSKEKLYFLINKLVKSIKKRGMNNGG